MMKEQLQNIQEIIVKQVGPIGVAPITDLGFYSVGHQLFWLLQYLIENDIKSFSIEDISVILPFLNLNVDKFEYGRPYVLGVNLGSPNESFQFVFNMMNWFAQHDKFKNTFKRGICFNFEGHGDLRILPQAEEQWLKKPALFIEKIDVTYLRGMPIVDVSKLTDDFDHSYSLVCALALNPLFTMEINGSEYPHVCLPSFRICTSGSYQFMPVIIGNPTIEKLVMLSRLPESLKHEEVVFPCILADPLANSSTQGF